jgi:hypothetical protein
MASKKPDPKKAAAKKGDKKMNPFIEKMMAAKAKKGKK